jgi:hypothetical protein
MWCVGGVEVWIRDFRLHRFIVKKEMKKEVESGVKWKKEHPV